MVILLLIRNFGGGKGSFILHADLSIALHKAIDRYGATSRLGRGEKVGVSA
jgi:hypothetical protein